MENHKIRYRLKNVKLDRFLSLPKGVISIPDLEEAKSVLLACHGYLDSMGLGHLKDEFVIEEEVNETVQ